METKKASVVDVASRTTEKLFLFEKDDEAKTIPEVNHRAEGLYDKFLICSSVVEIKGFYGNYL